MYNTLMYILSSCCRYNVNSIEFTNPLYNSTLQENEHVYDNIDEKEPNPSSNNNTNISEENMDYVQPKIPPQLKDARKEDSYHETQGDQYNCITADTIWRLSRACLQAT